MVDGLKGEMRWRRIGGRRGGGGGEVVVTYLGLVQKINRYVVGRRGEVSRSSAVTWLPPPNIKHTR